MLGTSCLGVYRWFLVCAKGIRSAICGMTSDSTPHPPQLQCSSHLSNRIPLFGDIAHLQSLSQEQHTEV